MASDGDDVDNDDSLPSLSSLDRGGFANAFTPLLGLPPLKALLPAFALALPPSAPPLPRGDRASASARVRGKSLALALNGDCDGAGGKADGGGDGDSATCSVGEDALNGVLRFPPSELDRRKRAPSPPPPGLLVANLRENDVPNRTLGVVLPLLGDADPDPFADAANSAGGGSALLLVRTTSFTSQLGRNALSTLLRTVARQPGAGTTRAREKDLRRHFAVRHAIDQLRPEHRLLKTELRVLLHQLHYVDLRIFHLLHQQRSRPTSFKGFQRGHPAAARKHRLRELA